MVLELVVLAGLPVIFVVFAPPEALPTLGYGIGTRPPGEGVWHTSGEASTPPVLPPAVAMGSPPATPFSCSSVNSPLAFFVRAFFGFLLLATAASLLGCRRSVLRSLPTLKAP